MKNHKILLVDDEESILFGLGNSLTKEGYLVDTASSGETAIEKLKSEPYDLTITDLVMDHLGGIDVLKQAKEVNSNSLVILLTGHGNLNSAIQALQLGAFDYIEKPCEKATLLKKVNAALSQLDLKREIEEKNNKLEETNQLLEKEIEERKQSEKLLQQSRFELETRVQERTAELREKNTALGVLLKQLEVEKKELNKYILANIENIVAPLISKIKANSSSENLKNIELLEKKIRELSADFGSKISDPQFKLTPKEIEICDLIRSGLSSKEIAEIQKVSAETIETHRSNIRKKLGLSNQSVNLTSYLKRL
jgi:DNA-binding NarL/FixJ family response regulator